MGPVLYFRGLGRDHLQLAALTALPDGEHPPILTTDAAEVMPTCLASRLGQSLWRYDFALPVGERAAAQTYAIGERSWRVHVPARAGGMRVAFTACNGVPFEEEDDRDPHRNERWRHLAVEHERNGFNLLLQGGDQLYADTIWPSVPSLDAWQRLTLEERIAAPFTAEMRETTLDYYFDRYLGLWSQEELAPLLASIPSLMMWDDHDIFDGWGSYEADEQLCPVYQGIFAAARATFAWFQFAAAPDDLPEGFGDPEGEHFGFAYRAGSVGVIVPDLRSQRAIDRIMGEDAKAWFAEALDRLAPCRHVLFLSTVPLVYGDLAMFEGVAGIERLFAKLAAISRYQDDLRDQWRALAHRAEWADMARTLVGFTERTGVPVTVVSGEIHLGAVGSIDAGDVRVHQLTSSGVVSPPPPSPVSLLLEFLSRKVREGAPGISLSCHGFPGLGRRRYLRKRNWLELDLDAEGAVAAAWHAEDVATPYRLNLAGPERSSSKAAA
ncbi:alkaline phosphatase D family protein [Marinivivus vitaminiproducens]|uniref:alkaline phosphatase D family protein n=1 Tax=Marinivivus vitaminiproducens TaxID=3035935 RepID=UPI0027A78747|nr:alkaline phosphatase D family protein [Geminicoccaceae bacterium SCSIO 64248]